MTTERQLLWNQTDHTIHAGDHITVYNHPIGQLPAIALENAEPNTQFYAFVTKP